MSDPTLTQYQNGLVHPNSIQVEYVGLAALNSSEVLWRDRYAFLRDRGYILRPRYSPEWKPSWLRTNVPPYACEDAMMSLVCTFMVVRICSQSDSPNAPTGERCVGRNVHR